MKINDLHRHLHAPPDLYWTWLWTSKNQCLELFSDLHLFISTFSFLSKNSETFHIGLPLKRHLKHKNINFDSGCSHVHCKPWPIGENRTGDTHAHTENGHIHQTFLYSPSFLFARVVFERVCVCASLKLTRVDLYTVKTRILTICKLEAEMLMLIFRVTRIQYGNVSVWWGKMYMYNHLEIFNWEWERKIRFIEYWMVKWWNWEKSRETFYDEWWHAPTHSKW